MRVISGSARGRTLKAVPGMTTRPTTDKVKEAVFSMIGPYFEGGLVLDLFAGTGGLGIEALSRGMDKGIFIDIEKKSVGTVQHNVAAAGFTDKAEIYRNDAGRALKLLSKRGLQFDLVFLDPPYKMKVIAELITGMEEQALLKPNAWIIVEHDAEDDLAVTIGALQLKKRAEYGETAITIYERVE
ncbi:16S rRNA (guanine(966)-N(2))-methyltransferase RsmD [Paenibacillus sp. GP183]|uniref:16S rRNA (guanine(966)-N(2))-methyltransferase RsmD n=1 Tax=Paenibacillus sp. GP183 TaxID=1882751 RepID=UPI000898EEC8|nr:16S rRNA (guanine(966)-N(2))-methyltransferase RsmD [Paenibacillus sp. GP183]SEB45040.1 16S rRNA (guanine(966)-N(2))-methyltransferase RsmD [Paenibacillus sp. GP183]